MNFLILVLENNLNVHYGLWTHFTSLVYDLVDIVTFMINGY